MAKERLSDQIENKLARMILSGQFPPKSTLPLERDLAAELGVGRPTLREAMQRLERDGWIRIKKGSATLVNDYLAVGNLNILNQIVKNPEFLSAHFASALLELRAVIAPEYTRLAVEKNPSRVVALLVETDHLDPSGEAYAHFDWHLHKSLAVLSENPLYVLLLNSFDAIYPRLAAYYFEVAAHRERSDDFFKMLMKAAMNSNADKAYAITQKTMQESIDLWQLIQNNESE